MKAAILNAFGTELLIGSIPDPIIGTGEVVVQIVAAHVVPYAAEVLDGTRQYDLALPAVPGPGGVGRVCAVGPDATHLAVGDWVYCDPTIRSRDDAVFPDITLQGLSARGPGGQVLQRYFKNGAWAEQMLVPTENAICLGEIEEEDALVWCKLGSFLVPYGGLRAAALQPGETVLINGATGNFGSAGVAVALALGAGRVVAAGRNSAKLNTIADRLGARVQTVSLSGDITVDSAAIKAAAAGPIDVVLDILPPAASVSSVQVGIAAVRPYGRIVLMGGIGMQGPGILEIPYAWLMRNCIKIIGQWMYEPSAPRQLVGMVNSGLVDLFLYNTHAFSLDDANLAVKHAQTPTSPFDMTVLHIKREPGC